MGTFRAFARRRRGGVWLRAGLLGLGVLAAVALIGSANAGNTSTKFYTASFSPALAQGGVQHGYTFTLTNCGVGTAGCDGDVSSQTLGSANITIPANYSATVGANLLWSVSGTTLQYRAGKTPSIPPGGSASVTVNVTPNALGGSYCYGPNGYTWLSRVKQSNNFSGAGNDFIRVGNDPVLTVASLVFTAQPTDAGVGQPIPDAAGGGVSVGVVDGCGQAIAPSGGVSMTIDNNPNVNGAGTLSGGASAALSGGTATFNNLSIDTAGSGYTLQASGASGDVANLGPVESDPFNIGSVCTSVHPERCTTDNGGTTLNVSIPPVGSSTELSLGSPSVKAQCSGKTSLGAIATIVPNFNTGTVTVTLVYSAAIATTPGISSYIACINKTGTWIALANCTGNTPPPCVASKQHPGGGTLTIVLTLPADDPASGGFA